MANSITNSASTSSTQVIFIDSRVQDIGSLLAGFAADAEVHVLDAGQDGLTQINQVLAGRSGLDAIHLIGHGSAGSATLGSTSLTNVNLGLYQSQLAELGGHLTASGDLLLYGCNVAQGADGQAFIEQIAQLTGADVAASTDLTGAAVLGGDWVLEDNTGVIDVGTIHADAYVDVLPVTITQGDATGTESTQQFSGYTISNGFYTGSSAELTGATASSFSGGYPVVTGIPAGIAAGTYTLKFQAYETALGSGSAKLTVTLSVVVNSAAPPNSAPTAGVNHIITINAGDSMSSGLLNNSNTGSSDPDSDALTYALSGSTVSAPSNAAAPERKGSFTVGTQTYTIDDGNSHTATGTVMVNATYADDPTTWGSGPSNQSWITSGTNSYQLSGASDPDDSVSYSIVSGAQNWMHISGGQIYGNVAPEFAEQTYNLTVRAQGSNAVDKNFTITTGTAAQLNDLPTASTGSQTVAEDAPAHLTFAAANFNFADLDNSAGGSTASGAALTSIRIDTLTSHGSLTLNGNAVTSSQVILTADIANLKFTPTTDYSGSDSFTYSVNDGLAWSASPTTMNITVTPSNDAPVLVDGRPTLTTITENDTTNAGNLVSDLIARTGGGANLGDKSGVTDVDTLNNGGAGNAPESVGLGIAITSATNNNRVTTDNGVTSTDYGTGTGHWEYSINNGTSWTAVGTVSSTQALLLSSTDKLRFIPDAANGTMGTLTYYLWDAANGTTHATKVDVTTRDNATPYSVNADTAYLVVSNVNDAPVLDLDGNNSSGATGNSAGGGASYTKEFLVRGAAVVIADTDMTITDVDTTGGVVGPIVYDTIASAAVAITAGATDNLFGTTYETLTAASTSVTGSLGTITIANSGTASISISGAGTWAEYQDIIKAITYQNANPNAYPGARTVTVSITDSATAGGSASTVSATSTITNVWAPSVDTNGVAGGVTFTTAYTEGGTPVKIATADATITDQDSHLKQVVVSISNVRNAGSETLTISGGNGANWNGITGMTVSGSGTSTITLTGDLPPNNYQLALRSISYANSSDAPDTTQRDITVVVTDINDHVGDTGHTYINLTAVNDAPVLGAAAATFTAINEDDSASTGNTVAQLITDGRITDPDLSSAAPEAIAVSAVDNTHGTWQYKISSGVWTAFDFTSNSGKALLLDSTDSVRFVPTADWNGIVATGVTFYAWDKTSSAVAGDYLTVSGNTGTDKVLSTATGTAAITINAVNDAPVMSGSGTNMTSITEDATNDVGQAVSALLATVTDIDSATQGIAVYSTTVTGPTTGGKWQFNVNSGGWTDFGTVSEGAALLLKSTDLVRFVPDTKNGQTASFDYYAWDQYSGTAGSTTNVATRGGATAYSLASDSVSITVTNLNDAPVLDLDTGTGGTSYSTNFLVRSGVGVAVANSSGISISDVDVTAANVAESIAGATVAITGGAVDNTFGTIYEKLTSGSGASVTSSLGTSITISGSGTPTITISGAGTPTEYQNIIKAITYENTNPNAYTGARTVTVTLTDSALTGGSAGTTTATTTITNLWAPVVDTNGVATTLVTINGVSQEIGTGVKYTTTYTQGGSPVKVATADATITDEDSFLQSVVVSIHDSSGAAVSNGFETLSITSGNGANWNGLGLTVAGSGTDTITLTGNLPPSIFQLALRSISYANTAPAPGEVTRTINVVATDIDNHVGYTGHTDINVIPVNSTPTLAAVAITGSIVENGLANTTVDTNLSGTLVGSDVETAAGNLVYGVSGGSAGSGADAGKVIAAGTYGSLKVTTSGGAFEYVKNAAAIEALGQGASGQDVFTVTVADGTAAGSLTNTSPPTNGPARTYTVNVTGANDAPVGTGTYTHTITDTAALDTFANLTGTLTATDVDTADTLTWSGSATGSYGALTVNANGTYSYVVNAAAVNALQSGSNATDNFTITVTDSQGATATRTIAMTVTAASDTPVAVADTSTAREKSGITNLTAGFNAVGSVLTNDSDVDQPDTLKVTAIHAGTNSNTVVAASGTTDIAGQYGTLHINANGSYEYNVSEDNTAVQALNTGNSLHDIFTYTVTDSAGASATAALNITIEGANDAPVLITVNNQTINELPGLSGSSQTRIPVGQTVLVGTLGTQDPDDATGFTYSIVGGTDQYSFQIVQNGAARELHLNSGTFLNTENQSTMDVVVKSADDKGHFAYQTFVISIADVNEFNVTTPLFNVVNMAGFAPNTVPENTPAGTFIEVTASAIDADATTNQITYSLVNSNGTPYTAGEFRIDASTGKVYTGNSNLDREAGGDTRIIFVKAVSAGGSTAIGNLQLTVANLNDNAPVFTSGGVGTVNENAATSTVIYTAATTDADNLTTRTYTLSGSDASLLNITSDGVVTLKTSADFETKASYSFNVIASDGANSTTKGVIVSVVNVNGEGPIAIPAPAGDVTMDNSGTDPISITGVGSGVTVNISGSGNTSVVNPLGSVTISNTGNGTVTVTGVPAGSTVTTIGTGPIVINTSLAVGEKIIIDAAVNGNILITNGGAGLVEVHGNLTLNGSDTMTFTLNGTGTTVMSEIGTLNLGNAPLKLNLATGYNPAANNTITLISNDGNEAVTGIFAGLPEGAGVIVGGHLYNISYIGGDGNDVVLHMNNPPTITNVPGTVQDITVGQPGILPNFTITDEPGTLDVTLTAVNGTINGLVDRDTLSAGIQLKGTAADLNAAIANATFTAIAAGAAAIDMVVTDASNATASAHYVMLANENGIPVTAEGSVPSLPSVAGGTMATGDGNGDGIADSQQAAVASVPLRLTSTAVSNPGTAPQTFITLVADSKAGILDPTAPTNTQLTSVQQFDAPTALPKAMDMPLGLLSFSANVSTPGTSESFSLFVDSSTNVNGYWAQNSSGTWINLATKIETVGGKTRIDFAIADGGAFDIDHLANGTINDLGAVGNMPLTIVGATPDHTAVQGFFF